jgi:hypothetical protein
MTIKSQVLVGVAHITLPDIPPNSGLDVLVFKVVNETHCWQASIRFTDAKGNSVKGIKVTLDPEAKN